MHKERYQSGTPRAGEHRTNDGKNQHVEGRITDYWYCTDSACDWTISPRVKNLFEALAEFRKHNINEHNGRAHLMKR